MELEPEVTSTPTTEGLEFAEPKTRSLLQLLRDTEAPLRRQTVDKLVPVLPSKLAQDLQAASTTADDSLNELAEVDLDAISDEELHPARILIGLTFVGFGALLILVLLLYLYTLHPELNLVGQMQQYWYEYIWFVCIGVTGMMMLGREAMRQK